MIAPRTIPVLAAPSFDPGALRVEIELPEGLTVAEIVQAALPAATASDIDHARVALVTARGSMIIERSRWHAVRPKPGVHVVIRIIPGKGALRAVLSIVVAIAAVALAQIWGPTLGATLFGSASWGAAVGSALVGIGVTVLGQLLINALIPPVKPDTDRKSSYSISGWRNRLDPDGCVPFVIGTMRYAPPFAARPYTEIVGDDQYVRAVFVIGEGEVEISDIRIGETSIDEFDEIEVQIRSGVEGDEPITLYPNQVVEEQVGVELVRPLPRNDTGDVVSGPSIITPVTRTTGSDASGASVILAWPGGLVRFDDKGRKQTRTVSVLIEHRLYGDTEWATVQTLNMTAKKAQGFYRQFRWDFPTRGRWQVRLTMLTDESDDSKIQQRTTWAALQTIRPEYPLAYNRPLALIGLRIKATHQINGSLDNINCMVSRICRDWDAATGTWVRRVTENPASALREVLQHPANPKAVADAGIDLDLVADWHAFCTAKGLTYNRVLEEKGTTLRDVLTEVAVAGRATPRHDGRQWGVVIDRPSETALVVDEINPRNSWAFKWSRSYAEPPHAFVVTFFDASNDYEQTQRVVRWPGHTGDITLTEELALPGKVYADEVWREARRRQLETIYRPDTFEATQEGSVRVATRGDAVVRSHYLLSQVQVAARVVSVIAGVVEIDEIVSIAAGTDYALRWRVFEDKDDALGTSIVRTVSAAPGETSVLTLDDSSIVPEVGALVHFGPVGQESALQIVTSIETTEDQCSIVRTVAAAPEIDTILDATEIPEWDGRVGDPIVHEVLVPPAPVFTSLESRVSVSVKTKKTANDGDYYKVYTYTGFLSFLLTPAAGYIATSRYEIDYRKFGATEWTTLSIAAASGGGRTADFVQSLDDRYDDIPGDYVNDVVEIRARAVSYNNVAGPYTAVYTVTIDGEAVTVPPALDDDAIQITELLGGALVQVAVGDAETAQIQVYLSGTTELDRDNDTAGPPVAVQPQQTISLTVGDTTRSNILKNPGFDDATNWTEGTNWTVSGGVATHAPGAWGAMAQSYAFSSGKAYRIGWTITRVDAGSVWPRLNGGSVRLGTKASTLGRHVSRIIAASGNDTIEFAAQEFDGAIDDVVAYVETTACLTAGTHYIWLEPQSADGVPGAASGPFQIEVI